MSKNNAADDCSRQERRSEESRPRPRVPMSYELSIARLRTRGWLEEDRFYSKRAFRMANKEDRAD
jgi:hypothetical protein